MDENIRQEIVLKKVGRVPGWIIALFGLVAMVGIGVFVLEIVGGKADEAWQIFLVNFVFWTGLAQGGIILSCALRITHGKWGRPLLRVSEAMGAFLPVSFLLLFVVFLGREHILPYATEDYHNKAGWLSMPFVILRQTLGLAILFTLSLAYVYYSLRQDLGGLGDKLKGIAAWVASDWKGDADSALCWKRIESFAPAIVILFFLFFSLVAFDFMMSLDPHWFSSLFGVFYCVGSFLGAICLTVILSIFVRNHLGLSDYITQTQYRDIGRLMFAFSLAWTYMFFSQFMVIWYANMPEETAFVIKRINEPPFQTLSWVVLSLCFFFPVVALIPRTNKVILPVLAFIATVLLSGLWLEKVTLIVPSLTPNLHISGPQIIITLGFLALFLLMFSLFAKVFPMVPVGDPLFKGKISSRQGGH